MKKNLINIAKNFLGTKGFAQYYNKNEKDILNNGELSCAIFISTILTMLRLIDGVSYTVRGLIYRIEKSKKFENIGKIDFSMLEEGDIIVWNPIKKNGNFHIGIYVGCGHAISNRSSIGTPGEHSVEYTGLDRNGLKKATINRVYRIKSLP